MKLAGHLQSLAAMHQLLVMTAVGLLARVALAEPAGRPAEGIVPPVKSDSSATLAIAVNTPVRWFTDEKSLGASVYVHAGGNHVVRANAALYPYGPHGSLQVLTGILGGDTGYTGSTMDLGASYMYFTRRPFDGFAVEAGALYRREDGVTRPAFEGTTVEKTGALLGRAMVGWSWLFHENLFVSFQLGAAIGYQRGTETECSEYEDICFMSRDISELAVSPEGMLRIGAAFEL